jgi:hypothetical protein
MASSRALAHSEVMKETVAGIIAAPFPGVGVGVAEQVPGLRPAGACSHNLPVQLTSFIGRAAEMACVRGLLADNRLVTLTGAGGVGKTRLALAVAASVLGEFPAGVWLVDLVPVADSALVPVVVARALGLPDEAGRSALETVTGFVGSRGALLVLDNCEHLLDTCAALAEDLLRACPELVILATSREPVGADGEATWRVPSMPHAGQAVELFADRARRAVPDFEVTPDNETAVAEICRRLDGIPLAIELAAARLSCAVPYSRIMEMPMTYINCPAWLDDVGAFRWGLPASVLSRDTIKSTSGPLECVMIRCSNGYWFKGPIEFLALEVPNFEVPTSAAAT